MANWGHPRPGRAQGLAYFSGSGWGTMVAEIVELSVDADNKITLHKVYCAIDPGVAINPGQITAQVEGGIILGLSAALGEAITLKDGRVEQTNFDAYSVPRLRSIPQIEVSVLQSTGVEPSGVGEPPVPPSMPALANAVFAATGKRIRTLPLASSGFSV
jgi:isoquinoline 1-oxidoreductase beta subunit